MKTFPKIYILLRSIFISLLCLLYSAASAQFMDDFSDSNWQSRWQGMTEKFTLNSAGELQLLDASATSPAQLYTPFAMRSATTWQFYLRMDFSPSTTNFAKIYLSSTTPNFSNTNGYFLRIGGISGTADSLELYRQDGTSTKRVLGGRMGTVGGATVVARIQVSRDASGKWNLATDYTGGNDFQIEKSGEDNTYSVGNYFGLECIYTSTRSDKFFFDDIFINTTQDVIPPKLISVTPITPNEIILIFDEALAEATASTVTNYNLTPTLTVINASLTLPNEVLLEVQPALENFSNYTMRVTGIEDLSGNQLGVEEVTFSYVSLSLPTANDIIINEIMADPTPSLGLPETEYIELYNRSDKAFDLQGIKLSNATKTLTLPTYILLPDAYLLIYKVGTAEFNTVANQLALNDFLTLTNTIGEVILSSSNEEVLDAVNYSDEWYKDTKKSDGGWSLELISPDRPCEVSGENWQASENGNGGTPGRPNSVLNATPDEIFVGLIRVFPLDSITVRLFFEESVDERTAADAANYTINDLTVAEAFAESPYFNTVLLKLQAPAVPNISYTVTLSNNFSDCQGNRIGNGRTGTFALPDVAESMDLVINEVLFNPATGGVDFLEIYNRSEKILNLGDLIIASRLGTSLSDAVPLEQNYLLFPNSYAVLTSSPQDIVSRYQVESPGALIMSNLPSLDDKEGTIVLYRAGDLQEVVLDEFSYSNTFHNALLDDENGVSLERINPNSDTQDASNWHSAAASVGFATPTYRNSQFLLTATTNTAFSVATPVISPDGDGFQDFLLIDYQLEEAGFLANVTLFDAEGQLVKEIAKSELLALEGQLKWDGDLDNTEKARIGIYLLFIEYFSPSGKANTFQTPIVVATRLE